MARQYLGVDAYETKQGTRYRYNFRDSDRKLSGKRGFLSAQAAAIDKAGAQRAGRRRHAAPQYRSL